MRKNPREILQKINVNILSKMAENSWSGQQATEELASKPKSCHSLTCTDATKYVWSGKSRQPIRKELSKCQPIRGGFANEEVQLTRRVGWNPEQM